MSSRGFKKAFSLAKNSLRLCCHLLWACDWF